MEPALDAAELTGGVCLRRDINSYIPNAILAWPLIELPDAREGLGIGGGESEASGRRLAGEAGVGQTREWGIGAPPRRSHRPPKQNRAFSARRKNCPCEMAGDACTFSVPSGFFASTLNSGAAAMTVVSPLSATR